MENAVRTIPRIAFLAIGSGSSATFTFVAKNSHQYVDGPVYLNGNIIKSFPGGPERGPAEISYNRADRTSIAAYFSKSGSFAKELVIKIDANAVEEYRDALSQERIFYEP
jgi:hypothetical protein